MREVSRESSGLKNTKAGFGFGHFFSNLWFLASCGEDVNCEVVLSEGDLSKNDASVRGRVRFVIPRDCITKS